MWPRTIPNPNREEEYVWEYVDPMTSDEIYHYGTKGMHWGERLYQNPDGSLTQLGRLRYGNKSNYNRVQAAKASIKKKRFRHEQTPK